MNFYLLNSLHDNNEQSEYADAYIRKIITTNCPSHSNLTDPIVCCDVY